jgi:SAM-dependent methyltransferase
MYKDFAYIYDKLSFDIAYDFYAENIKKLIKKHAIKNDRMLELACGSGKLTEHFFDDFKEIDAVDLSEDMLNVFSQKHGFDKAHLFCSNMVEFVNENSYDLIVVLLDSVNYLTDKKDFERLIENSYKNLKKGGLLVFDLNSEYKMKEIFGDETYVYEYEDIFYSRDCLTEGDIVDMELNFFIEEENGFYKRIIENQVQRIYSIEYAREKLLENNFSDIEIFDEDDFSKVKEDSLRILFSAVKK